MMMNRELVNRIREYFELNIYETKVWLALLSRGIASAGEIASLSNVPRSRTYDVLESLEKRGFAIVKIGKPVKYIAIKPTEVLEKMKSTVLQESQDRIKNLSNLRETPEYLELEKLHRTGISPIKTHDITGSLKGRSNIISRLKELIGNAKKEIQIVTSVTDFEDKSRVLIPALEQTAKNNTKIKIALAGSPERIKRLNLKHNFKISQTNSEARMYIADKEEILFMITSESSDEEVGVWLHSQFFVQSLTLILEATNKKQPLSYIISKQPLNRQLVNRIKIPNQLSSRII